MKEADFLDLSNDTGIIASVVLTFNFLLGMLLSMQYKRMVFWERMPKLVRKVDVNDLHNYTAYVALALVIAHPLFLLFAPSAKFRLIDIIFPLNAPHQKLFVAFGTTAMLALIIVIITTQKSIKRKMGFRFWKNVHLISYGTALLFIFHGIFLDPKLKESDIDFLDGEKLVAEICGIVLFAATILRYRYYLKGQVKKERQRINEDVYPKTKDQ